MGARSDEGLGLAKAALKPYDTPFRGCTLGRFSLDMIGGAPPWSTSSAPPQPDGSRRAPPGSRPRQTTARRRTPPGREWLTIAVNHQRPAVSGNGGADTAASRRDYE